MRNEMNPVTKKTWNSCAVALLVGLALPTASAFTDYMPVAVTMACAGVALSNAGLAYMLYATKKRGI